METIRCARALQCGHAACATCLLPWLVRSDTKPGCMTCRTPILAVAPIFAVKQTEDPTEEETAAMKAIDAWRAPVRPAGLTREEFVADFRNMRALRNVCRDNLRLFDGLPSEVAIRVLDIDTRVPETPVFDYAVQTGKIPQGALHLKFATDRMARDWPRYDTIWKRLPDGSKAALLSAPSFRERWIPMDVVDDLRVMETVCLAKPGWLVHCAPSIQEDVAMVMVEENRDNWEHVPEALRTADVRAAAGRD